MPPQAERRASLESAMRRALDLARRGPARNANPRVGCVIVDPDGRILSEGWHRGAGTAHAETDALAHLPNTWHDRTNELTAVVTLEPCNHTGFTGPCTEAILAAGIGTVACATSDPGMQSGGGAAYLRERGVTVIEGVLEADARVLLSEWFAGRERKGAQPGMAPHVIAKWAQTLDGRAAAADGSSQWITGPEARAHVHSERAQVDAILVGTGTLLVDNPSLTARTAEGDLLVPPDRQPVPVVFGRRNIPDHARILTHPALTAHGLDRPITMSGTDLAGHLALLRDRGFTRLYVEGGPTLVSAMLREGLVDELHTYVAPKLLGGEGLAIRDLGISNITQALRLEVTGWTRLGEDLLVISTPKPRNDETGRSN